MLVGKKIREDYIQKFCPSSQANAKVSLLKVLFASLHDRGFRAVMLYRMGRCFQVHSPVILAKLIERLIHRLCFCEISTTADIGPGFRIYHPFGLVIGAGVRAGKNFNIRQDSTFGATRDKTRADGSCYPIIGDNVAVAGGVRVVGPVDIGDNCGIGANAVVVSNIPSDCIAAGVPARIIRLKGNKVKLLDQRGELSEVLRNLIVRTEQLEEKLGNNKQE